MYVAGIQGTGGGVCNFFLQSKLIIETRTPIVNVTFFVLLLLCNGKTA
jgi:hypothetical protein